MSQSFQPVSRPVRVGIVGLGRIYDLTVRGYRDNPDAEVVALCDTDTARLAQRGAEWPAARQFTDLADLLAEDLDLVEVLVPSKLHCEVVCAALDAGHHVTVQKPMARNLAEADRMIAARDRAGVQLRVMENYLFYEPLVELKRVVESGEIGDVAGYHMKMVGTGLGGWDVPTETWMWQLEMTREDAGGIMVYDDGWHKFSVARWLFGEITEVMAWVGRTELGNGYFLDAPSTIMWKHANGIRGVHDITLAPDQLMRGDYYSNDERFEVTGKRGFARVNHCTARGLQQPSLEVYSNGILRQHHALDDDWGSAFDASTRNTVEVLRAGKGDFLWGAEDARAVLEFVMAVLESSRRNAPVSLPM